MRLKSLGSLKNDKGETVNIKLWNKGYVTDEVSSIPVEQANLNEENRKKWVTDLAASAYKKTESKKPDGRYNHLLKEAAPDFCTEDCDKEPSRPLEMLPVVLKVDDSNRELYTNDKDKPIYVLNKILYNNYLKAFSYFDYISADGNIVTVYTNMRACLKAGIPYNLIPYNTEDEIKKGRFLAIRSYTPMFVWAQDKTHCRVPSVSSSGRYVIEDDYWLPSDIFDRIIKAQEDGKVVIVDPEVLKEQVKKYFEDENMEPSEEDIKYASLEYFDSLIYSNEAFAIPSYLLSDTEAMVEFLMNWSQRKNTEFFKKLGYSLEIAERAIYYFKYKMMIRAAWGIDPRSWRHYLLERSAIPEKYKNKTQAETAEEAAAIRKIYENKYGSLV